MDRDALLALAERCEQATGADRALDYDIAHCVTRAHMKDGVAPTYTAFLDAALSLVPERWRLRQMNFSGPCADDRKWHLNLHGGQVGDDTFVGRGATPALALTAACLKARALSHPEKEPDLAHPIPGEPL